LITKLPTAIDLIEAGARCLQGKCLVKVEEQKTQEEMSQRINEVIDEAQKLHRPARLKMVQEFARYHNIEGEALSELITWLCDYKDPVRRN